MTDERVVVGGRYVLGERLGHGGMAEVHRALDERLGRPVAVKRMNLSLAADRTAQVRFRREAHAAASLNHPAVASVFDTGSDVDPATGVDVPYLVMELVEGRTLRAVLRDGPPLDPDRALEIISQVLAALAHSHAAGIVHRDIKPANVMLTSAGAVKVMDFGIARAADESTTSLTKGAAVIGTAQYLSPEQARGERVDQRSDLYSTGCLLYELLLGRPLFVGESSVSLAYQHVNEEPVPPREHDPSLSPELDAVVLKALAKDPADRYQTAARMKADVDRLRRRGQVRARSGDAAVADDASTVVRPTVPLATAPTATLAATTVPAATVPSATGAVAAAGVVPDETAPFPAAPRRRGRVALLVLAALLLVGAAVFAVPRLLGHDATPAAAQVRVPDVRGRSRDKADTAVRNVDLVPRFTTVAGADDDTVDTVVQQTPAGGMALPVGSTVTLQVNVGPDSARIPTGLVGLSTSDAKKELKQAHFDEIKVRTAASQPQDAKKGEVLTVEPGEGVLAPLDATVVLVVAGDVPESPTTTQPTTQRSTSPTASSTKSTEPSQTESASASATSDPTKDPSDGPSASSTPTSGSDPSSTPSSKEKGKGKGKGRSKSKPKGKSTTGSTSQTEVTAASVRADASTHP